MKKIKFIFWITCTTVLSRGFYKVYYKPTMSSLTNQI